MPARRPGRIKRRLKKVDITYVSLCPRGINLMPTLYKSDDDRDMARLDCLTKYQDEKGELLAVTYVPDVPDAEGDAASAEVVKEACHSWMRNGARIDIRHDTKQLSSTDVYCAENFVVQKGDARFEGWVDMDGNPCGDLSGSWAQIYKIENPELRRLYREEGWSGVSMFGPALVEPVTKEDVVDALANSLEGDNTQGGDMDEKILAKVLKEALAADRQALVEDLTKALTPKEEKTEPEVKTAPVAKAPAFEGDPNDLVAIEKWQEEIFRASLDFSKAEDVQKWRDHLVKKAESSEQARKEREERELRDNPELANARKELKAAEERIRKLEGRSQQPADLQKQDDSNPTASTFLTKEEVRGLRTGRRLGAIMRKQAGQDVDLSKYQARETAGA